VNSLRFSIIVNKAKILLFLLAITTLRALSQNDAKVNIWFAEAYFEAKMVSSMHQNNTNRSLLNNVCYGATINNGGRWFFIQVGLQSRRFDLNVKPDSFGIINEGTFGFRYYPRIPNFHLGGDAAVRFTGGALFSLYNTKINETWYGIRAAPVLFAGFCISTFYRTSGIVMKLVYRPVKYGMGDFVYKQPLSFQIGVILGPKVI
jgi:hypothetical protein